VKKSKNPQTKTLVNETMLMMRVVMHVEDDGDCWEWTGATSSTGHPIINVRQDVPGMPRKGCHLVRRLVRVLDGHEITAREPIGCRCNNKLCVNPAHLFQSSVAKVAQKAAKAGAWTGAARARKISAKKRANAKINFEIASEIRLSTDSGPVLAERFGVHKSLVNSIKRGVVWRDYSTPFAGLGARA
jgi:hypothetical protein